MVHLVHDENSSTKYFPMTSIAILVSYAAVNDKWKHEFLNAAKDINQNGKKCYVYYWLSSIGGGAGGAPLRQFAPPLEIWSESNSITKEICITIDSTYNLFFVPHT